MKVSTYLGKNQLQVEERPVPAIGDGELLLKVDFCGICGTDIKKVQYGLAKAPTVLGHEITGTVVASKTPRFGAGDRIAVAHHVPCFECHYCRHNQVSMCAQFKKSNLDPGGFAEYCRIPRSHVDTTAFKLDRISQEEGIFMEPLACAVRNIDAQNLQRGDVAVVVGLGSMGLLSAQALKARGVLVIGLDLKEDRLALARTLGVDRALSGRSPNIHPTILELTDDRGADIVIVTAGSSTALQHYFKWIRGGGTLNIFSSLYPEEPAPIPTNDLYHREIQVTSSYSASPVSLQEAHRLLESGDVKVKPLISEIYPLRDVMKGVEKIAAQESMKILINPALE